MNYSPCCTTNVTYLFLDEALGKGWGTQGKAFLPKVKIYNVMNAPGGQRFCLVLIFLVTARYVMINVWICFMVKFPRCVAFGVGIIHPPTCLLT